MTQIAIMRRLLKFIQNKTPFDTGNLTDSTKIKRIAPNVWELYIEAGDDPYDRNYERGVAPYIPFVNEKWTSARWRGRKNPNENYWNNAIERAIVMLSKILKGELESGSDTRANS